MRRLQLIEIEDQPWCPRSLRDGATDYLGFAMKLANPHALIAHRLATALARSGDHRIVDLCSGGGGPWRQLMPRMQSLVPELSVTLTDLYPNVAAFASLRTALGEAIDFTPAPVDATDVPAGLPGFRTIFLGFHHLPPVAAAGVLADAVSRRQGIGIFEITRRTLPAMMALLPTPLIAWAASPFLTPFRWSRLLWTYPVPVLPALVLFDGLVSCARTYTVDELRAMTDAYPDYEWSIGLDVIPHTPMHITYCTGVPRATNNAGGA